MSMTYDGFCAAAKELAALDGLDEDTALDLLAIIGDTPCMGEDGLVVVTGEDGTEYRLKLPVDDDAD